MFLFHRSGDLIWIAPKPFPPIDHTMPILFFVAEAPHLIGILLSFTPYFRSCIAKEFFDDKPPI